MIKPKPSAISLSATRTLREQLSGKGLWLTADGLWLTAYDKTLINYQLTGQEFILIPSIMTRSS
nr:hypothetical protein [Moorena producens]